MTSNTERLDRLKQYNAQLVSGDKDITAEVSEIARFDERTEMATTPDQFDTAFQQESIIMRRFRPALRVIENKAELKFADKIESEVWKQRLKNASDQLRNAILAVGRINLTNAVMEWVGTGWLIQENIIVTNRHVAIAFTKSNGRAFEFKTGLSGLIRPDVDFLQEFESDKTRQFALIKPIYVVPEPGPDVAFFEVEQTSGDGKLAQHIRLAKEVHKSEEVATIGYPAYDSRIPDVDLMERIYGREYNKKRLAPGAITNMDDIRMLHNCTTLGGNSGSAIIDLNSGEAMGLHFSGAFMRTNYAVRADIVRRILDDVLRGKRPYAAKPAREVSSNTQRPAARPAARPATPANNSVSVTVPLTVMVTLGDVPSLPSRSPAIPFGTGADAFDDDFDDEMEARPEDYIDREGYDPNFLGADAALHCPLPVVERDNDLVLDFEFEGERQTELKYQHFSVVMNRARRMCFFSAVNINGKEAKPATRVGWKREPRIPRALQIKKECYGRPPKFSRGHMTRRNDPSWGANDDVAKRGNTDSMHVTNATPQMQAFNSPIWLQLEDYALENAIDDGMRISVFTGPVFRDDDPIFFGVAVPVAFWKIIAFVHDHTGALTATGYRLDQEQSLPTEEEFVFGAFTSTHLNMAAQVSIRSIEEETGLRFGLLADRDPFSINESVAGPLSRAPLLSPGQVRFF